MLEGELYTTTKSTYPCDVPSRQTLTKCSGLQFLLDCIPRENTHKTPVVKKPINGKLSASVIYLGIGLELSIVCMSSPFPFSCSLCSSQGNALKT